MKTRLIRATALVLAVLMLAALPILTGCGGQEKSTNKVVIGWLGDQTGISAGSFKEVKEGVDDYLASMRKTDPIPGVDIEVVVYDARLDDGRIPTGYDWLAGQGMDLLFHWSAGAYGITLAGQQDDGIASFCFTSSPLTEESGWAYAWGISEPDQGEWIAQSIADDWDYAAMGRPVRVGYVDVADVAAAGNCLNGMKAWMADNPGKIDFKTVQTTGSQTAFATELNALMDSDVMVFATVGPASAAFIKEARSRGYSGRLQATSFSFLAYLTLIKSVCGDAMLDGVRIPHSYPLFTDASDYVAQLAAALEEYRPSEADLLKGGTTWISGWMAGFVISEAVRSAVDAVGADRVDGLAIRDSLRSLDILLPGTEVSVKIVGDKAVLFPYTRMVEYDSTVDDLVQVSDYTLPPRWGS